MRSPYALLIAVVRTKANAGKHDWCRGRESELDLLLQSPGFGIKKNDIRLITINRDIGLGRRQAPYARLYSDQDNAGSASSSN